LTPMDRNKIMNPRNLEQETPNLICKMNEQNFLFAMHRNQLCRVSLQDHLPNWKLHNFQCVSLRCIPMNVQSEKVLQSAAKNAIKFANENDSSIPN
jgi:hypothetical protein